MSDIIWLKLGKISASAGEEISASLENHLEELTNFEEEFVFEFI